MTKTPLSLAIGGLLAMAAGMGVGRFVYTPILPPMVEALHLTKSQAGLIASANFIGYFAGALLAALRFPGSRRLWLLGALVLNVVCLAANGRHGEPLGLPAAARDRRTGLRLHPDLRLGAGARSPWPPSDAATCRPCILPASAAASPHPQPSSPASATGAPCGRQAP
ncbi:MAG: YbfB/YjiJ family MFS transporter [Hyphomicrobium sp.]